MPPHCRKLAALCIYALLDEGCRRSSGSDSQLSCVDKMQFFCRIAKRMRKLQIQPRCGQKCVEHEAQDGFSPRLLSLAPVLVFHFGQLVRHTHVLPGPRQAQSPCPLSLFCLRCFPFPVTPCGYAHCSFCTLPFYLCEISPLYGHLVIYFYVGQLAGSSPSNCTLYFIANKPEMRGLVQNGCLNMYR
ncbi:hypothetical protein B0T24DRAFT_386341 [Lasiosphaeria ovina]|uniref:Uncharacterized protein n=1 Tax=Lasiosphaeria ovina TaxID=92902 RepID=A0AAE0K058_9PEZI|nr:hypothetical protein B0T24DRAFT_386341 [Lasiosphaeria ovina]